MNRFKTQITKIKKSSPEKVKNTARDELLMDIPLIKVSPAPKAPNEGDVKFDPSKMVSVQLDSITQGVKPAEVPQEIPLMVSLITQENPNTDKRVGLDIVMAIDVSGSMMGQKIQYVVETLLFLIDEMKETDRLSLVAFNNESNILTNLTPMTPDAKKRFKEIVNQKIQAGGSTNINAGMSDCFDVLLRRREVNDVSSIFLLSDGQDTCGNSFKDIEKSLQNLDAAMIKKGMDYKINSFGYGGDHDEKILAAIANLKDGQFYYIKDVSIVDECFIDCLGYLMSIFARHAEITLYMEGQTSIKKRYGSSFVQDGNTSKAVIKIGNIACGIEKNFICELILPAIQNLGEIGVCNAILNFVADGQNYIVQQGFRMPIVPVDTNLPKNAKVEKQMVRVQAAEALNDAMEEKKRGNIKGASKRLQSYKVKMEEEYHAEALIEAKMLCNDEVLYQDKDIHENLQILDNQAYRPSKANFSKMNTVQVSMKARKKG